VFVRNILRDYLQLSHEVNVKFLDLKAPLPESFDPEGLIQQHIDLTEHQIVQKFNMEEAAMSPIRFFVPPINPNNGE